MVLSRSLRERKMQVKITEDCIACELCVETCPEVFEMGEEIAQVRIQKVPPEYEDETREAAEQCPVSAIILEE
jgi:ferredoxin